VGCVRVRSSTSRRASWFATRPALSTYCLYNAIHL
jgi:hypothetical protein